MAQTSAAATAESAATELRNASLYIRGLAGFAGRQSKPDHHLGYLLSHRNAESIFLKIIEAEDSTPAGLAYAFCGLSKLKSDHLPQAREKLARNDPEVFVMHGDVMGKRKLSQIVATTSAHGC